MLEHFQKIHIHITQVSITTVQRLENVSQETRKELITQNTILSKHAGKMTTLKYIVHEVFFFQTKNLRTLPKCSMHIFNVSITSV
jgi:hypothetical protein